MSDLKKKASKTSSEGSTPRKKREKWGNQDGDVLISLKDLLKEPSPDKFCSECNKQLERTEKWKELCTRCFYRAQLNQECLFD